MNPFLTFRMPVAQNSYYFDIRNRFFLSKKQATKPDRWPIELFMSFPQVPNKTFQEFFVYGVAIER